MPPAMPFMRQLGEAALLARHDLDVRLLLEALDAAERDVVGGVDLALLQRRDHGVGVGEDPEDDPVDASSRPHQLGLA